MLPDGRVGFIDFGIVSRITPVTWTAMEALLASLAVGDYNTMARALATIGACRYTRRGESFARLCRQSGSSRVVFAGHALGAVGAGECLQPSTVCIAVCHPCCMGAAARHTQSTMLQCNRHLRKCKQQTLTSGAGACAHTACCCLCSEDVDYDAFGRDLQSFFTELESLNSSLVVTADAAAGGFAVVSH